MIEGPSIIAAAVSGGTVVVGGLPTPAGFPIEVTNAVSPIPGVRFLPLI